ncbi:MAG: hypothetical protein J4215_04410 [Candidatus Diapherotrites archaeon]|uniref:Phosphoglycerol geranylgeranyltransferase n=1 Tax=Candidatus Iainarchaeum sp. TaxID=3101447 RepID=A0A8T4LFY2_9ARCH|nr:hypothetical protein [Candidatus Diapherotrites archaeon]
MERLGKVEKKIYSLREDHPLVIPQIDPDKLPVEVISKIFQAISDLGIQHIALGGSIITPQKLQIVQDMAVKDYNFSTVTYPTNSAVCFLNGHEGKTAIYWMSVLNSENPFFLRDVLVMNSVAVTPNTLEPIPTAYVFDDRGSMRTANWLARAVPIPREKPEISLSVALAAQYLGMRIYIMAGGSGSELGPPATHVELLARKTNLFIIPTSGILTPEDADLMFKHKADAIHVGKLIEEPKGIETLKKMVSLANKYPGKIF